MENVECATETPSEKAFRLLGGAPGIKRRYGISLQAAHKWQSLIPPKRALDVSDATGVDLRALLEQKTSGVEHPEGVAP